MPVCAPRTAAFRSASAKMMLGLLPPSSMVTRLFVSAAIFMTCRPTSVDPVNEILSTSGWRTSAAPAVEPPPGTTLNAPAGNPASSVISAKSRAVSGADDADRLPQRIGEEGPFHRERVADDLVRPSRVVAQRVDRHADFDLRLEE